MSSTITALTSGGGLAMAGDTSGQLQLLTNNGTAAVTINTSQQVGIGQTSPTSGCLLDVKGGDIRAENTSGSIRLRLVGGSNQYSLETSSSTNALQFIDAAAGAERMRIDSSGNAMVGTTGTTARFEIYKSDSVGQCVLSINNPDAQGTGTRISFKQTGEQAYFSSLYSGGWNLYARSGSSGGVVLAQNATSWTSTSDERLKNITGTYSNALADIAQIQPIKFTWKSDEANTPQVGVTAQSVQNVVPEAVTQCKMSEDDPTEYLGVRYTELIPLLIASVQELNAKVEAQALEIKALKGVA